LKFQEDYLEDCEKKKDLADNVSHTLPTPTHGSNLASVIDEMLGSASASAWLDEADMDVTTYKDDEMDERKSRALESSQRVPRY